MKTLLTRVFEKMEEDMVKEAEIAGKLYLDAGIVDSSRYCWSLASHFFAETFNFGRLSYVYEQLSRVIETQIPVVNASNSVEFSNSYLGRFYRVWFHGSAPDELVKAQGLGFVYRTNCMLKIDEFGCEVESVMSALIGKTTHIELVLDDGRHDKDHDGSIHGSHNSGKRKKISSRPSQRRPILLNKDNKESRNEQAKVGICEIKITPLRPILTEEQYYRGSPAWFRKHTEIEGFSVSMPANSLNGNEAELNAPSVNDNEDARQNSQSMRHREGYLAGGKKKNISKDDNINFDCMGKDIIGVNTFSFTQPLPNRGSRDWLKGSVDFCEKSLRATRLQVGKSLPACATRARVTHREVFHQSPLEASIGAVCGWCSVLFRTAVAANGIAVLGSQNHDGIGPAATRVIVDSLFSSRIKEIAKHFLTLPVSDEMGTLPMKSTSNRLGEEEVIVLRKQLARGLIMFMELLHILILRNRELLAAAKRAKRHLKNLSPSNECPSVFSDGSENITDSPTSRYSSYRYSSYDASSVDDNMSVLTGMAAKKKKGPDSNAANRELEMNFTSTAKILDPLIDGILQNETPQWLKFCCKNNYFKSKAYRTTFVAMGEELFFGKQTELQNVNKALRYPKSNRGNIFSKKIASDNDTHYTTPPLPSGRKTVHPSDTSIQASRHASNPTESSYESVIQIPDFLQKL